MSRRPLGRAARRAGNTAGAAGIAACCAGMVSMLPGAVAGVLGALGISGSGVLARTLSPVAQPLYIGSAILVVLGALACSRLVAIIAVSGSGLLYLSMFQLASSGTGGTAMASMAQHAGSTSPHSDPTTFYLGLALLVAAFALNFWRRRRRECRPLLRLPQLSLARR